MIPGDTFDVEQNFEGTKQGLLDTIPITSTELDQLGKMPSLSELNLHTDSNQLELDLEAGQRFLKLRPDVVLLLSSRDQRGNTVSHVFGQEPETTTDGE